MSKGSFARSFLEILAVVVVLGAVAPAARAQTDLLVSSRASGQVLRYDGATGAFLGTFVPAGSAVGLLWPSGMTVGPDGNVYVSNGVSPSGTSETNNGVFRFDPATGAFIDTFSAGYPAGVQGIAFGPDGILYGAVSTFNRVFRANGTTGAFIDYIGAGSPLSFATGITFGPDGNLYVGSFASKQVLRFNGTTGAYIDVFATVPPAVPGGNVGGVTFGPDRNLYIAISNGTDILRFDGTTGAPLGSFIPAADPHPQGPIALVFGPDGNAYVSSRDSDTVLRYNGTTGAFIDIFASGGGLDQPFFMVFVPKPCLDRGGDPDGDGICQDVDNCPTVSNASQSDSDGDGVGDACDNCVYVPNPRVDVALLADCTNNGLCWATLTGGQRDDDHDGYGNKCDAKFPGTAGTNVGTGDLQQFNASLGKSRLTDTCGTASNLPCAIFDLDEGTGLNIGTPDRSRLNALIGLPAGGHTPAGSGKCPTCPLACIEGVNGSCN